MRRQMPSDKKLKPTSKIEAITRFGDENQGNIKHHLMLCVTCDHIHAFVFYLEYYQHPSNPTGGSLEAYHVTHSPKPLDNEVKCLN